ncbi:MAG: TPM domain-containing protein [Chloroflexota bacterium]
MNAEKFFSADEQERIRQAIIEAESKTAGEIVPMVVTASARYTEVELFGLIIGLFLGMIAEFFWSDPWASAYVNLWPVVGAFAGFFLSQLSAAKRLVATKRRIADAVHNRALAEFTQQGLHYTREHTGILILVSLLEHRVEVLADRGINDKVEPDTWQEIVGLVSEGLKSNRACDNFCAAIERCGAILAKHFPRRADDTDELPNRLVTE